MLKLYMYISKISVAGEPQASLSGTTLRCVYTDYYYIHMVRGFVIARFSASISRFQVQR